MLEWGTKLALAEDTNSHGRPLEVGAGLPQLGLPGRKMPVGVPRPGLQVGAQGVRKCQRMFKFSSVQCSRSVMSNSLQ